MTPGPWLDTAGRKGIREACGSFPVQNRVAEPRQNRGADSAHYGLQMQMNHARDKKKA